MKRFTAAILSFLWLCGNVYAATTLLPNGEQCFANANGPLSNGSLNMFVPNTTTPKTTWKDSGQVSANTQPIQLDANGCAIIYGVGTYRQMVFDGPVVAGSTSGNLVWDKPTTDTSAGNTSLGNYAGVATGTPNSITLTAPNFSGGDGQVVSFRVASTNTAATTINVSGIGAINVVHDLSTGPTTLSGGELVATNVAAVQYDSANGVFHLITPVFWPSSNTVPVGIAFPFPGFSPPANYALAQGQCVSRTSFAALFGAYTSVQSGTLSGGTPTITGLADTSQLYNGQPIEGANIPINTVVRTVTPTSVTMSANATGTGSTSITFFAYSNCDGATTFGLPDYRGYALIGRDTVASPGNVQQVVATVSTTSGSASANVSSASGLATGMNVIGPNIPSGITLAGISGTTITLSSGAGVTTGAAATRFSVIADAQGLGASGGAMTHVQLASELVAHGHSVTDPGHGHSVTDPGHGHSVTDPSHVHTINDSGHTHAVTDPGHVHLITDPGHVHQQASTVVSAAGCGGNCFGTQAANLIQSVTTGTPNTASATTGITINTHTTGLTVNSATTGITAGSAVTGVTVNSNTTGVTVNSNTTGVTVNSAGGGLPFSITQPIKNVNYIIRLLP